FENYGVPFCMTVEAENMGATVNMGNEMCEPHIVKSVLNSCSEMANLKEIDLNIGRVKVVLDAIRLLKSYNNQVPVIANLTGPISLGGTLLDMSVLLKQMRKTPIEAEKYLDFISDNLIKFANAQINAGADVICIAEPSGTGEILGPKLFMQYTVKYLNKIMDAVNVPVKIIHICGNLSSVYNCLSKLNCDVFSFDAVVPIKEVKKHLGNKVAMGNVSTFALGTMDEDKIKGLTKAALNFGADIISPACGLTIQTPLKNIQAMVDAVKQN
ncbi:MAG: uroporphyrinogen decarboxylase family protein, partial [Oscillospiraceae bacterium]